MTTENWLNSTEWFSDCPNCQTPWKCNGPHLSWISNVIYKSNHGYFMFKNNEWKFTPIEKEFDSDELLDIAETLINLNEKENDI
jgi:hypothetical protein